MQLQNVPAQNINLIKRPRAVHVVNVERNFDTTSHATIRFTIQDVIVSKCPALINPVSHTIAGTVGCVESAASIQRPIR